MINELKQAKDLMDNEQYESAITILTGLKDLPLKFEKLRLLFLSNSLYKTGKYYPAIDMANKLLQKDLENEYASQIKYLSYYELEDHNSALNEIISFLSINKANLYKVTLEELLMDIKNGNINEEDIIYKLKDLALKNNISL